MMRCGGRHTQQAVNILCNSSWYVLQTLVSVAGFRFARRASGRNGSFLGFAGLARRRKGVFFRVCMACKWSKWCIFVVCRVCKWSEWSIFGVCRTCK